MIHVLPFYRELHPDQKEDLRKLRNHLISSSSELAALKVWELQGQFLTSANNTVQLRFDFGSRDIFFPIYILTKSRLGIINQYKCMYLAYYIYYKLPKQKLIISSVKESKMFIASSFFFGGGGIKKKKIDSKLQSLGFYANFNFFSFVDGRFKLSGCPEGFEC